MQQMQVLSWAMGALRRLVGKQEEAVWPAVC
jgi:hypothetical protein